MATFQASLEFPPTHHAPGVARRLLRELLQAWAVDSRLRPEAELLVSEVVTNAVEHAGRDVVLELDVTASGEWLRVGLADGSAIRPVIGELAHKSGRGRGLQIVAAIADRWDSEDRGGGKRVWFDLTVTPS